MPPEKVVVADKPLSIIRFWRVLNDERGIPIGRDAIRAAVREGRVEHFRVGNRALIPRSELDDFPERLRVKAK